jgi:hypothetical protein
VILQWKTSQLDPSVENPNCLELRPLLQRDSFSPFQRKGKMTFDRVPNLREKNNVLLSKKRDIYSNSSCAGNLDKVLDPARLHFDEDNL